MDIQYRCGALKEWVAVELQEALDTGESGEILIAALYELGRSILPALGAPDKSQEYLEAQGAVLELISFIAIPLVRHCTQESRGVAVLIEIGEGCLDPLLKKKLRLYAQQLLVKPRTGALDKKRSSKCWIPSLIGSGAAAMLGWWLIFAPPYSGKKAGTADGSVSLARERSAPPAFQATTTPPVAWPAGAGPAADAGRDRGEALTQPAQGATEAKGEAAASAEPTTKVRIANNQVLVPVTLKNEGETVKVELVLDTGSTRTSIHEGLAARLRIDLRQAKLSQSEAADGRLIRSRSATIDSLGVGPFAISSAEVVLIPYRGGDGLHDGLLGMDFLAKHRYQIDMEHELIRWF